MDRRAFLLMLAAGTATSLSGCEQGHRATARATPTGPAEFSSDPTLAPSVAASPTPSTNLTRHSPPLPHRSPSAGPPSTRPTIAPVRLTPPPPASTGASPGAARILNRLPGKGKQLALTVDDGINSDVVGAYVRFAKQSGIRLTFFLNGVYRSWTEHARELQPLVDSGQVQLANHTWSHPRITGLSDRDLAGQISRNEEFINKTFGVTGRPYFRPPYGRHNARTDRIVADLGYTQIAMWYGDLGDYSVLSEAQLMSNARQWMTAQRIVIGHANHPAVTHLYGQILDLIQSRQLQTVTLRDVFNTRH
jgi:peptidoglycan/xylan/chitin deacetylase (PgdA/CDA1 family)